MVIATVCILAFFGLLCTLGVICDENRLTKINCIIGVSIAMLLIFAIAIIKY